MPLIHTTNFLSVSHGGISIAVRNLSSIPHHQVLEAMRAIQVQVTRDFFPIWGMNCNLELYDVHRSVNMWQIVLLDEPEQANVLGYHDVTASGLPLAKIFIQPIIQASFPWTVVFSHEVLEMLADPYCELTAFNMLTNTTGRLHAYEVCDPVQDDSTDYLVGDIPVSNFVFPGWFEEAYPSGKPVDFCHVLNDPLFLGPQGYISVFDIGSNMTGWTQIWSAARDPSSLQPSKDRLALRERPKMMRKLSNPSTA